MERSLLHQIWADGFTGPVALIVTYYWSLHRLNLNNDHCEITKITDKSLLSSIVCELPQRHPELIYSLSRLLIASAGQK